MATLASVIVGKAQILLHDTAGVRWTATELLGWLNDGCVEVCSYKPDACTVNEAVVLSSGTKQTLPAGGLTLIGVKRNFSGSTPGRSVRELSIKTLDDQIPDWHSDTSTDEVKFFCFDPRNQKNYYVYPPSDGAATSKLEIVYTKTPAAVEIDDPISVDDSYAPALLDYIMHRALSKDADYAGEDARASIHYAHFIQALGGKEAGERVAEPPPKA